MPSHAHAKSAALKAAAHAESGQGLEAYMAAERAIFERVEQLSRAARNEADEGSLTGDDVRDPRMLCAASRAGLDSLPNLRDIAAICPMVRPGRLLRSACPPSSPEALRILLAEGGEGGVRTFIDLRDQKEDAQTGTKALWQWQTFGPPRLCALLRATPPHDEAIEDFVETVAKETATAPTVADIVKDTVDEAATAQVPKGKRHVKFYVPYTSQEAM
jgi:hypothetical protein